MAGPRIGIDTNVLVYAEGVGDAGRAEAALALVERLPLALVSLSTQVVGELHRVLVRKRELSPAEANRKVLAWLDLFEVVPTSLEIVVNALRVCAMHRLQIFDAIILAAAAEAGCSLLLSEDLQHGFSWRGVTVVNPFAPEPHPLLVTALQSH
jgi:predicted nucleic acid-binding protein